jgi:hypothetical protein
MWVLSKNARQLSQIPVLPSSFKAGCVCNDDRFYQIIWLSAFEIFVSKGGGKKI